MLGRIEAGLDGPTLLVTAAIQLAPLLPVVRRHPARDGVLLAQTRVARYYPLEWFHLIGYRKLRRPSRIDPF